MKSKTYKIKTGQPTIGDMEMEWLSQEEQEKRWEEHRAALKEWEKGNKEITEQSITVEDDFILDEICCYPFESNRMLIWNASKNKKE